MLAQGQFEQSRLYLRQASEIAKETLKIDYDVAYLEFLHQIFEMWQSFGAGELETLEAIFREIDSFIKNLESQGKKFSDAEKLKFEELHLRVL